MVKALAKEKDQLEREKWDLRRQSKEASENASALHSQLDLKENRIKELEAELAMVSHTHTQTDTHSHLYTHTHTHTHTDTYTCKKIKKKQEMEEHKDWIFYKRARGIAKVHGVPKMYCNKDSPFKSPD